MTVPPLYAHQRATRDFGLATPRMCDWSDPGTGKTRAHLEVALARGSRRALVLGPLSILKPAWGNDIAQYTDLSYSIAYANCREKAFTENSDVVLLNHDGVAWLRDRVREEPKFLKDFDTVIIDEVNAYKNPKSRRTKAMMDIRHHFEYRDILTGTPAPQSLLDFWAPVFICDDGQRLGTSYYAFRNQVTVPVQVGPRPEHIRWVDKAGARETIALQLADISIRHDKDECLDIPENTTRFVYTTLPPRALATYKQMLKDSMLEFSNGALVNAVHAGARANKLLQICTGAVYDADRVAQVIHTERYSLVMDMVEARPWPCLVAYNWTHEHDQLVQLAEARGITYGAINGSTPISERERLVQKYQAGEVKVIFAHPQSAGHGLTLTRGRTTIWTSPTPNAEYFLQFNARVHRAGQRFTTETILIAAEETREADLYTSQQGKVDRVHNVLDLFLQLTPQAAT